MKDNAPPVEGPPWDTYKRFSTFEEADAARAGLLEEADSIQVKVKWMPKAARFIVKTREDPTSAAAEAKREEKRRRKKRLNKKRRKK